MNLMYTSRALLLCSCSSSKTVTSIKQELIVKLCFSCYCKSKCLRLVLYLISYWIGMSSNSIIILIISYYYTCYWSLLQYVLILIEVQILTSFNSLFCFVLFLSIVTACTSVIGCVTSLGGGWHRLSGQFASPVGVWGTGDLRAV